MASNWLRQELSIVATLVVAVTALIVALVNGSDGGGAGAAPVATGTAGGAGVTVADFQEKGHSVVIANFAYSPDPVRVKAGQAVTWVNEDEVPHTATAKDGSWDSGTLPHGEGVVMIFSKPGTYPYICLLHPPAGAIAGAPAGAKLAGGGGRPMQGTIIVE